MVFCYKKRQNEIIEVTPASSCLADVTRLETFCGCASVLQLAPYNS